MKRIIYLSALLLTMTVATVQAQDDIEAYQTAIDSINWGKTFAKSVVKDGAFVDFRSGIDGFLSDEAAKHAKNKDAKRLYAIAQSYYVVNEYIDQEFKIRRTDYAINDTAHALKYIRMAIEADPTYSRPYILAAKIMRIEQKTDEVMGWYERGLKANPTDEALIQEQFKAQSRIGNIADAIAKLEEMRKKNPDYPVELEVARLYRTIYEEEGGTDDVKNMVTWYDKVPAEQMIAGDMYWYALMMPTIEKMRAEEAGKTKKEAQDALNEGYVKAADLLEAGCTRFPTHYGLNQLTMRYLVNVKRYDDAVTAYNRMRNSENAKDEPANHYYLAQAYIGQNKFDKAEEELKISETMEGATAQDADNANGSREYILNLQVLELFNAKKFDEAIAIWKDYMDKKAAEGKLDIGIKDQYFTILHNKAQSISAENVDAKIQAFKDADEVLRDMLGDADDTNTKTLLYNRKLEMGRHLAALSKDIEYVYRAALEQIEFCEALPANELQGRVNDRYTEACFWISQYFTNKFVSTRARSDRDELKKYGNKVLDFSNNNEHVNKVMELFTLLKIN